MHTANRRGLCLMRTTAVVYMVLAAVLGMLLHPITAYASGEKALFTPGAPITLGGWSAAIVATGSMQSVIPRNSLIITMPVDAEDLAVGDDIMFMTSQTTSVTHRIIGIQTNVDTAGRIAFVTKGVDNPAPDTTPVMEDNVVGKVVFHSYILGVCASFLRGNWPLLIGLGVLTVGCVKVVKRINAEPQDANHPSRIREELDAKLPRVEVEPVRPVATYTQLQPQKVPASLSMDALPQSDKMIPGCGAIRVYVQPTAYEAAATAPIDLRFCTQWSN